MQLYQEFSQIRIREEKILIFQYKILFFIPLHVF